MTWIIFVVGILLPILTILIAPSLPSVRRIAGVDRRPEHRIYPSRQFLVFDEEGRSEIPEHEDTANTQAERYELWWIRQPMRTADRPLEDSELEISPISVVHSNDQEPDGDMGENGPLRMKIRPEKALKRQRGTSSRTAVGNTY